MMRGADLIDKCRNIKGNINDFWSFQSIQQYLNIMTMNWIASVSC